MKDTLNPSLFRLLELHFGSVQVVSTGQEMQWQVTTNSLISRRSGNRDKERKGRRIVAGGEEYKVCCPFCGDTRHRLYINHRWGVYDEETGSRNWFLCQCFNEACVDNWSRQQQLQEWVFSPATDAARAGVMRLQVGVKMPTNICEVAPPGPMLSMEEMVNRHPNHRAVQFLGERSFDPVTLSRRFNVSYCLESRYNLAKNRIIIPIFSKGMMVGWQARAIGDTAKGVAKYWSCPGMAKRLLAYQFDVAVKHQTVVLVEGPTDVWGLGPQSTGLLGKGMHPALLARFVSALKVNGGGQTVVVFLDPEQDEREKAKGKPHHTDKLVKALSEPLGGRVFGVRPPAGMDPGSLDRDFSRRLIRNAAKEHNLPVSFARPTK